MVAGLSAFVERGEIPPFPDPPITAFPTPPPCIPLGIRDSDADKVECGSQFEYCQHVPRFKSPQGLDGDKNVPQDFGYS